MALMQEKMLFINSLRLEAVDSPPPFNTVLIAMVCAVNALYPVSVADLIAFVSTPPRVLLHIAPDTVG